ncbi:unannotated protein [freshwater metagenome]|uniref:Unannotated protein n=1 Tax=freshwater metagenome TaxID=449393 RepID=A0A6J7FCS7_9ZZZZ
MSCPWPIMASGFVGVESPPRTTLEKRAIPSVLPVEPGATAFTRTP